MSDETPSAEHPPTDEFDEVALTTVLVDYLQTLRNRQMELLRLSDFMSSKSKEIDDFDARAREHISARIDEKVDDNVLGQLIEAVRFSIEEDEGSTDENMDAFERRIDEIFETLPKFHRSTYLNAVAKAYGSPPSTDFMYSSLLVTCVSEAEICINYIARACLEFNPDPLLKSEAMLGWAEIRNYATIEELRRAMAADLVDKTFRGSLSDWMKLFESRMGTPRIDIAQSFEVREVFQRRHCVVHYAGVASQSYLDNLKEFDVDIRSGEPLQVDGEYLSSAADSMYLLCYSLVWACIGRLVKSSEHKGEMFDALSDEIYFLLQEKRFELVIRLSDHLPADKLPAMSRHILKVNRWLSFKTLGRLDEVRREIEQFDTDVLDRSFKLAKMALLDDLEGAVPLAFSMVESGDLPEHQYASWPLLKAVRERTRESGLTPPAASSSGSVGGVVQSPGNRTEEEPT